MGSVSIDVSVGKIWRSWYRFVRGKRRTQELEAFSYHLEDCLWELFNELQTSMYRHGPYTTFEVNDTKRRTISVASIRDRVVHRLLYDYLYGIYNKTFLYDVWSCRVGKGLLSAIVRAQEFLQGFPNSFVWRMDIRKFFDSVDHAILKTILSRRVTDGSAMNLLNGVIDSFQTPTKRERERESYQARPIGLPIGNLTSQIFANIYLNEWDRYVVHTLRPKRYLRYGDDCIIIEQDAGRLAHIRSEAIAFANVALCLRVNSKNDIIIPARQGVNFLGVEMFPHGRRLKARTEHRALARMRFENIPSYDGIISQHDSDRFQKVYHWKVLDYLENVI